MDLNKLLQTGSLVELELSQPSEKKPLVFHVIVDTPYSDGTFTISTPMHQGRNYPVKIDSFVKVVFSIMKDNEQEAYSIKCKVLSKSNKLKFNTIKLDVISQPEKVQRREYFRFSIVKNIRFLYDEKYYEMLTVNLSATGIRGISTKKIPDGDFVTIEFPLEKNTINLIGEVVNSSFAKGSKMKYDIRIKFPSITETEKSKITNFIFSKQSEMAVKSLDRNGYKNSQLEYDSSSTNYLEDHSNNFRKFITPISLLISITLIGLFTKAMPEKMNGLDVFFHNLRNPLWKQDYLYGTLMLSLFQLIFCSLGIMIKRRESIKLNSTLLANIIFASILIFSIFIILVTNGF